MQEAESKGLFDKNKMA